MHMLPLVLLAYSTLIPPEVSVSIGDLSFYVYRVLLFAMIPLILRRAFLNFDRFNVWDLVILTSLLLIPVSLWANHSIAVALETGMSVTVDLGLSYFLARSSIRTTRDFQVFLVILAPGLAIAGLTMMAESLSSQLFVRPLMAEVFGGLDGLGRQNLYYRLGLLRAYGPFSHPILGGLHLAMFLAIYWYAVKNPVYRMMGMAAAAMCFFTLSSGPLLALVISAGLIFYNGLQRKIDGLNWQHMFIVAILGLVIVEFGSENGIVSVVTRYLTFNSSSSWYRLAVWEFGTASVKANPLLGVGWNSWERARWMVHETIDAHFLWMAVRFGLPASLLLLGGSIAIMFKLGRRVSELPPSIERDTRIGVLIALFSLELMMFTVTLFGSTQILFMLMLGAAASLSATVFSIKRETVTSDEPPEAAVSYTHLTLPTKRIV